MKCVFQLEHKRFCEMDENTGEKIFDTKMLGFFSSLQKCDEVIRYYVTQPGFCEYPEDFYIEEIEANVDDFHDKAGMFRKYVYYLTHEWYDGEYDIVTTFGCYSSMKKAKAAEIQYRLEPDFAEHSEGFCIDKYEIDKMEWKEGFFTWKE